MWIAQGDSRIAAIGITAAVILLVLEPTAVSGVLSRTNADSDNGHSERDTAQVNGVEKEELPGIAFYDLRHDRLRRDEARLRHAEAALANVQALQHVLASAAAMEKAEKVLLEMASSPTRPAARADAAAAVPAPERSGEASSASTASGVATPSETVEAAVTGAAPLPRDVAGGDTEEHNALPSTAAEDRGGKVNADASPEQVLGAAVSANLPATPSLVPDVHAPSVKVPSAVPVPDLRAPAVSVPPAVQRYVPSVDKLKPASAKLPIYKPPPSVVGHPVAAQPVKSAGKKRPQDFLKTAHMLVSIAVLVFLAGMVLLLAWFLGIKFGCCPARLVLKKKDRKPTLPPIDQMKRQREMQRNALGLSTDTPPTAESGDSPSSTSESETPSGAAGTGQDLDLDLEFRQAGDMTNERLSEVFTTLTNAEKLSVYAMYKQADEGDATGDRPSMFDIVGRAKYDAWAELKGMPSPEAKRTFIAKVNETAPGWRESAKSPTGASGEATTMIPTPAAN